MDEEISDCRGATQTKAKPGMRRRMFDSKAASVASLPWFGDPNNPRTKIFNAHPRESEASTSIAEILTAIWASSWAVRKFMTLPSTAGPTRLYSSCSTWSRDALRIHRSTLPARMARTVMPPPPCVARLPDGISDPIPGDDQLVVPSKGRRVTGRRTLASVVRQQPDLAELQVIP